MPRRKTKFMRTLTLLTLALAGLLLAASEARSGTLQRITPTTSEFVREALTNETAAGLRAKLGIASSTNALVVTNFSAGGTNIYVDPASGEISLTGQPAFDGGAVTNVQPANVSPSGTFSNATKILSVTQTNAGNIQSGTFNATGTPGFSGNGRGLVGAIGTNLLSVMSPVYNVKDFGATGNGTTDDGPAIRNGYLSVLANGGGVLYLPDGIYSPGMISSWGDGGAIEAGSACFWITNGNITIRGAGRGRTIIRKKASDSGHVFWVSGTNITFEDLTIDGNSFHGDGHFTAVGTLIDFACVTNGVVKNCTLVNSQEHAVDCETHSKGVWVVDNVITNCGTSAIHGDSGEDPYVIRGNYIAYSPDKTFAYTDAGLGWNGFIAGTGFGYLVAAIDHQSGSLDVTENTFEHCPFAVVGAGGDVRIVNNKFIGGTDQTNLVVVDGPCIIGGNTFLASQDGPGYPIQVLTNKASTHFPIGINFTHNNIQCYTMIGTMKSSSFSDNVLFRPVFMGLGSGTVVCNQFSHNTTDAQLAQAHWRLNDDAGLIATNLFEGNLVFDFGSTGYGFYVGTTASTRNIFRGNIVRTSAANAARELQFLGNTWEGNNFNANMQVTTWSTALDEALFNNNTFSTFTVDGNGLGSKFKLFRNNVATFAGTATDQVSWTIDGNTGDLARFNKQALISLGQTNLGAAAIDFSIPDGIIPVAGGTLTFTAMANLDTTGKGWNRCWRTVTNSSTSATLAFPSGVVPVGSTTVTRRSRIEFYQYGLQFSNAIITTIN